MDTLAIIIASTLNIVCIFIGIRIGRKMEGKANPIQLKTPMQMVKERQDKKEEEYQKHRNDIISQNIDKYDGTGYGQIDVPM